MALGKKEYTYSTHNQVSKLKAASSMDRIIARHACQHRCASGDALDNTHAFLHLVKRTACE
jgi:hypothetical protein